MSLVDTSSVIETERHFTDDVYRAAEVVDGTTCAARCRPSSSLDVICLQRDVDNKYDKSSSTSRHHSDNCRHVQLEGESITVNNGNHYNDDDANGGSAERSSPDRNRIRCSSTRIVEVNRSSRSPRIANRQRSGSPKLLHRLRHVTVAARRRRATSWPSPSARIDASADQLNFGIVEQAEAILPEIELADRQIAQQQNESGGRSRVAACDGVEFQEVVLNVTATGPSRHGENSVVGGAVEPCAIDGCDWSDARSNFVDGLSPGPYVHLGRNSRRCAAFFVSVRCVAAMTLIVGLLCVAAGVSMCINHPEYTLGYALFGNAEGTVYIGLII